MWPVRLTNLGVSAGARVVDLKKMEAQNSTAKLLIYIIGPLKLQNELMACFLEKETGIKCVYSQCVEASLLVKDRDTISPHLILWDCRGDDPSNICIECGVNLDSFCHRCFVALFHVRHDKKIEKDALNKGVRGIFYTGDSLEKVLKGVRVILKGELWFPRQIMSECLEEHEGSMGISDDIRVALTHREQEILLKIASGASNKVIADELFISMHTVKTHLYNIYKKINVTNRLQAVLWAAKNL